jgi:RNA polymerase sigma-70 factor (ECF subfamily)
LHSVADMPWLQPYPDRLLDAAAPDDEPHAQVVERETIEIAFLTALLRAEPGPLPRSRRCRGWTSRTTSAIESRPKPSYSSWARISGVAACLRTPARPAHASTRAWYAAKGACGGAVGAPGRRGLIGGMGDGI